MNSIYLWSCRQHHVNDTVDISNNPMIKKHEALSVQKSDYKEKIFNISQLAGVWAENELENANFKIKGDSMYFLEYYDNPAYVKIKNDTLLTHYDGFITSDVILKLTSDSLWLLNEVGDTIKLYKR